MCGDHIKSAPTKAPYVIRRTRVFGIVSGSVSITNAKKNKTEYRRVVSIPAIGFLDVSATTASAETPNARMRSNRLSLYTTVNPPTRIIGSNAGLPATHHVAGISNRNADSTTANAAGLKICFPPIAIIYFDADARTATRASVTEPTTSVNITGVIINASIKAVIKTDSRFVTAPYIRAISDIV